MTKKMILRWIVLIVAISSVAYACVQLGEWQLRRLDERRTTNALVVEHAHKDPVPYEQVMNRVMTNEDEWTVVQVTGTFTGETYQVRYRNQDGPGTEVVSVMQASDGRLVLVDRGFLPRPTGQPDPEPPAPPTGQVTVTGYVQRNERGADEAVVPHEFKVRLINSDEIGASLGKELVNGYIAVFESTPADDALLQPITLPSLDEGPHESYAWQWFLFAAIAVIGIGVLIRADIKDQKKIRLRKERLAKQRAAAATASADQKPSQAPAKEDDS